MPGLITSVDEINTGRQGSLSLKGLSRKYVRSFEVITTSADVGSLQVELATGIPRIGASYIVPNWSDLGAIAVDIRPRQPEADDPTYWIVDVEYQSQSADPAKQQGSGGGGGQPGTPQSSNPLLQPAQVFWGTKKVFIAKLTTVNDPPFSFEMVIANSAGTPFDPPPQAEISLRTMRIVRNEPTFRPFSMQLYEDCINKDSFQGQDPGCALCERIDAQDAFGDSLRYSQVTYEFLFAEHHDIKLLDKGPVYLTTYDGGSRQPQRFKSPTGSDLGEQCLDGNGNPLPRNPVTGLYSGPPIKLRFAVKVRQRFADLHLPDPAWI